MESGVTRVPKERGTAAGKVLQSIGEGLRYAFGFAPTRDLLILLGGISLVGVPYVVLMPVFAREVLDGDAATLGLLTSCAGLGALVGALWLASRGSLRGLGLVIARATAVFGVALIAFGLSGVLWLSCVLLVLSGFGLIVATASINTVLQTLADEEMRGRVMSLYTMGFVGVTPLGSLAGGAVAARLGAPVAVIAGGLGCLAMAAWFGWRLEALRPLVRPIYQRMGIIPEVAVGIGSASELRPRN